RGDLALHGTDNAAEKAVVARRSIAVLGFKNLTGRPEDAWLSTAFAEMLSTELAAGGQLRVIPGENVARTRTELKLIEADSYSAETLTRIRRNLGADYIVVGSYLTGEDQGQTFLRVDMRLQDASGGETVATISERGTEAKLADMLTLAGTDL